MKFMIGFSSVNARQGTVRIWLALVAKPKLNPGGGPMTDAVKAILSSPIGFVGTTLSFEEIPFPTDLTGVTHYVGHPATKALIEALGAVPTSEKKFTGLEVDESYLAVPLALNPRTEGWTTNTAVSDVSQLKAVLVTRIA